jgi:hypothetical protein
VATKTISRITKVLTYKKDYSHNNEYHARFHGDENYSETSYLYTDLGMHVPDYDRLGKPTKIRITITVLDDE